MKPYVLLAVVLVSLPACGPQPSDPITTVVRFPGADIDAGRQVFLDLKCTACHRVPAEASFPPPISTNPGPALDHGRLANRDLSYLATAIISPSHELSPDTSAEVRAHIEGKLSPMGDFSRVMTVRQLIDVYGYLRSIE
jgi:hypothetical protein